MLVGAAALAFGVTVAVVVTSQHHHHPRPNAAPLSPFLPSATEQALPTTSETSTTVPATTTTRPTIVVTTTRPTTTTTTAPPVSLPPIQPGWVSMANIRGAGTAQSAVFHLGSADTKLRWVSSSPSFLVYVVDASKGLDATAGYADAECSGPCATETMALVEPPADYYLLVRSTGGSWAVAIEQYPATAH